jgi:hypothetical protein
MRQTAPVTFVAIAIATFSVGCSQELGQVDIDDPTASDVSYDDAADAPESNIPDRADSLDPIVCDNDMPEMSSCPTLAKAHDAFASNLNVACERWVHAHPDDYMSQQTVSVDDGISYDDVCGNDVMDLFWDIAEAYEMDPNGVVAEFDADDGTPNFASFENEDGSWTDVQIVAH